MPVQELPQKRCFAALWNVRLIPGWGLWPEPVWAWSRVSLASSNLISEMSPALRASWEMSTNADLGPLAEGGASLSLHLCRASIHHLPVPSNRRHGSQRALRASPSSPVYRGRNGDPDAQSTLLSLTLETLSISDGSPHSSLPLTPIFLRALEPAPP